MDPEAFDDLIKALVDQGYATWWDKNKKLLRIYWRSLERWTEEIIQMAENKEKLVIIGIKDLTTVEPKLASMPERDLEEILKIMVERKHARWINKGQKL